MMPDGNTAALNACEIQQAKADRDDEIFRDEAVADVAEKWTVPHEDAGEVVARLTPWEWDELLRLHKAGYDSDVGAMFALALDRYREEYMTSDAGECAIQDRIVELSERE